MIRNSVRMFMILILALFMATFAFSQRQTGSLDGKTVDSEGIPLPGATVTLNGPALMGTLTYTTSDSGDFRFPAIRQFYMLWQQISQLDEQYFFVPHICLRKQLSIGFFGDVRIADKVR